MHKNQCDQMTKNSTTKHPKLVQNSTTEYYHIFFKSYAPFCVGVFDTKFPFLIHIILILLVMEYTNGTFIHILHVTNTKIHYNSSSLPSFFKLKKCSKYYFGSSEYYYLCIVLPEYYSTTHVTTSRFSPRIVLR